MKRSESIAQSVWRMFEQIAKIPRPSGMEQQIGRWILQLAHDRGFVARSDTVGNIVVEVPASSDHSDSPILILQGHLDMVCQKLPDSPHDFSEPIRLIERDGWICADGTTLGADNGIGIALALALALEPGLSHPPLELLFTVDEESGLTGATALVPGFIRGKRMLNLDSEDDSFTVGCAGGEQTQIDLPVNSSKIQKVVPCQLTVSGLRGGHSGVNIHEQRANALQFLARCLAALSNSFKLRIAGLAGGSAHNAIPRDAQAQLVLPSDQVRPAAATLSELQQIFRNEYAGIDPEITLKWSRLTKIPATALSATSSRSLIALLLALPNGVHRFSREFEGVVETSSNLAIVGMADKPRRISIVTSQRSLKESCLDAMTARVSAVADLAGATIQALGRYPGWDPDPSSALLAECCTLYSELRGRKPAIKVIHAGLECGIIGKHFPGMDMVSLGPNIENAHSPQERLEIESVDKTWEFLKRLLPRL